MRQLEHLCEYELDLTTLSPLFIGSGETVGKFEYIYEPKKKTVTFIKRELFFRYLLEHNLVEEYEKFALGHGGKDLGRFLKSRCRVTEDQISAFAFAEMDAADALDQDHSLKDIHTFICRTDGTIYVPGSSVKGCLRTILLTDMLLRDEKLNRTAFPKNPKGNASNCESLEQRYLHLLQLSSKQENAVNDIMRGISVSDSEPVDEHDMILCSKIDLHVNDDVNYINVVRQCIRPQTKIRFRLTLDQSVVKDKITVAAIRKAIENFDRFYRETYNVKYIDSLYNEDVPFVILGGGNGYFSKNLVYPFYKDEREKAVKEVSKILQKKFSKHKHEQDIEIGISSRVEKITEYKGEQYGFGICKAEII